MLPLFVLSCTFTRGGLATDEHAGDVNQYHVYANEVVDDGLLPYDDFFLEYPPGSLLAFVPPALLPDARYTSAFKLGMALCGALSLAIVAALLVRRRVGGIDLLLGTGLVAVSPLLLGQFYLNRYDPMAAAMAVAALGLLLVDRVRLGAAVLALAFVTKVFVAATIPVVAVRIARRSGRRALLIAVAVSGLVTFVVFAPFAAVGAGGLRAAFVYQAGRQLHTESFGGSLVLAADRLGIYDARVVKAVAIDLSGRLPDMVATLSTVVSMVAILAVGVTYALGSDDDDRFIIGFVAAVVGFTAFSKAVSPQFLAWLIPLVALVPARTGRIAIPLVGVATLASQVALRGFPGLDPETWAVWTLVLRNLLLAAVFGILVSSLVRTRRRASP